MNRAVIQKGAERQLVWYWFDGRGRRLTTAAKGATPDSLRDGRSDGGLVRLITPIGDGGQAAADARLGQAFAAAVSEFPASFPIEKALRDLRLPIPRDLAPLSLPVRQHQRLPARHAGGVPAARRQALRASPGSRASALSRAPSGLRNRRPGISGAIA